MQPIKDLLNKIKWDNRENPEDYSLFYLDRINNSLMKLGYNQIKKIDGNFIVIERDNEEINIPMHRIREVKKNDKIIWKR